MRPSQRRLCLLLVGLSELRRRLTMAVHESLTQRIVVRYHLGGLTREEVPAYLTHRLQLAGCSLPLFEPAAIEALFHATQGLPRKINRIAHYALSAAALARTTAGVQLPQHAIPEMMASTPWRLSLSGSSARTRCSSAPWVDPKTS